MANRKSGKELRKDYRDLLDKTKAMRKRIMKRAEELIKQYPDVPYFKRGDTGVIVTVGDFKKMFIVTPQNALGIIEKVEEWVADQHPHKQLNLYKD